MTWFAASFWVILIATCACALVRGGWAERRVAALLPAAAVLTALVRGPWVSRYSTLELRVALVDVALLAALVVVAMRAGRVWPIALCALQAVTVLGHLGKLLDPDLWRLGYALMIMAPAYPGLLLLAGGTWRHAARTARSSATYSAH